MTFAVRFRTYEPATDNKVGFLPEPTKFKTGFIHNADGALLITYSELADGGAAAATALETGLDVALEVNWTGEATGWIEPFDSRFLLLKRNIRLDDDAKMHDLIFVPYSWLVSRVRNLNLAAVEGTKSSHAGQRKMYLKDAGDIMKTFLAEHEGRGNPIPITRESWTVDHDSLGNAWAERRTLYYNVGQDIHSVLDNLTDLDLCDWRFAGRDMRMYNADGICVDLSETVTLTMGDDLGEAPSEESMEDYLRRILVKGSKKKKVTVTATSGPTMYGDWEGFIDDGGVDDTADLTSDGNKEFEAKNRMRGTYDRDLTLNGTWLPFRDYNKGDWVTAPAIVNSQRMRVQQITITGENGVVSGSVTLNDRVEDTELARASKLASLAGGVQEVTGSGTSSDDQEPDTRQPDAPTGLTVTPELHLNATGHWIVRLAFAWTPNEVATDGTALDIAAYTVWGTGPGEAAAHMIGQTAASSPALISDGYTPGSEWAFTVQAHGVTTTDPGLHSATVGITLPTDTEAPPATSIPTLESSASILSVSWDGLDSVGDPMPADLARVEVLADTVNPPVTVVGNLGAQNNWLGYVTSGTTVYVAFRAVDTADNVGPLSAVSSTVVRSVVDDADLDAVLALKATTYVQDAEPVDPPAGSWWWTATAPLKLSYTADGITWTTKQVDAAEFLAVGTIVTQLLAAGSVQADTIAADSILSYHLTAGVITADKVAAGLMTALVIAGEVIKTAETGKRVVIDRTGIVLYDADDTPITFINTNGESFFIGTVTATTLKVIGTMELTSSGNLMDPGSSLILSAGIQGPTTVPTVSNYWNSFRLTDEAGVGLANVKSACRGKGEDGNYYWFAMIVNSNGVMMVSQHNLTTGAFIARFECGKAAYIPYYYPFEPYTASFVVGQQWYSATHTPRVDMVARRNYNGTKLTDDINLIGIHSRVATSAEQDVPVSGVSAGITVDDMGSPGGTWPFSTGGQPYIIQDPDTTSGWVIGYHSSSSGKQIFRTVGQGGVIAIQKTVTNATVYSSDLATPAGVAAGVFDIGDKHYIYGEPSFFRFTKDSDQTNQTTCEFATASASSVAVGWDGVAFWSADTSGVIYWHDGLNWTDAASTKNHDFRYTYYNATPYESKPSPKVTQSLKKRARLKISVGGWLPGSPSALVTQLRFYAGLAGTALTAQESSATGVLNLQTLVAGPAAPTITTFPASSPAVITNTDGTLTISADGTIRQRLIGAKVTKTTVGHNAAGSAYSANNWTQLSGFNVTDFEDGVTVDSSAGSFTAQTAGEYDLGLKVRWQNYGSVYNRSVAIVKGTSAPAADSSNVIEQIAFEQAGWLISQAVALAVPLSVGDVVTFWVRSATGSTLNASNTAIPGWTHAEMFKR